MIVVFKSGNTLEVPTEVIEELNKILSKGTSAQFQSFSDREGKVICVINITEIEFIHNPK